MFLETYHRLFEGKHFGKVANSSCLQSFEMIRQVLQWTSVRAWPIDRLMKEGTRRLQVHHLVCLKIWQSSSPKELTENLPEDREAAWTFADHLARQAFTQSKKKGAKVPVFPDVDQMPSLAAGVMESREKFTKGGLYSVCDGMPALWLNKAHTVYCSWLHLTQLHDIATKEGDGAGKVADEDSPYLAYDDKAGCNMAFVPFVCPTWRALNVNVLLDSLCNPDNKGTGLYEPVFFPLDKFQKKGLLFNDLTGSGNLGWLPEQELIPRYVQV